MHLSRFWPSVARYLLVLGLTGCNTPGCGPAPDEVHGVEAVVYASDTVVTYRDGNTRIGVLFNEEHRDAVVWDDLPPAWVVAIVAAEDGRFWFHNGIDASAVARAARDNVEAGTVVSGGSTLTQQTAKNLFDRPDRSLGSKVEELDYALHLEKAYTKRDILTFYANLFHVTGNGSGLGIGAKYFFDKQPNELTVVESAYLAGLVKGPANYDPFPGTPDQQAAALARAETRTRYVLERMVAEDIGNLVPKDGEGKNIALADVERVRGEAQQLLDKGFSLPFKKGVFRYDSSVLMDEVGRRLSMPYFKQILADAGVADPASAGLTIVTTLDEAMQREASYALTHHVSDLGVTFEALDAQAFVIAGGSAPKADPSKPPKRHTFRDALVTSHATEGGNHLVVDVGGFPCVVDRDAIVRAAVSVYRGQKGDRYAKAPTQEVDDFVAAIADGAVVGVSVRDTPRSAPARCDLQARAELQGAVVVVEDGAMLAMVGGTTGKDFNRATAPRQMGSTMKPLIYHAAMTLGWQPDDVIDNRRNVFPYSGTFYLPRPDHEPKPWISMAWAGVNSENLASVWLLHHLTDHLPPAQVAGLASALGLAKGADESDEAYRKRIQEAGVLPTKGRVPESLFVNARAEVVTGLLADGKIDEARQLRSLYYGWGFASERDKASSSDKAAFDNTWLHVSGKAATCRTQYASLERALSRGDTPASSPELSMKVEGDDVQVACGARPEGFVAPMDALMASRSGAPAHPGDDTNRGATSGASRPAADPEPEPSRGRKGRRRPTHPSEHPSEVDEGVPTGLSLPGEAEVLVDGRVTLGTIGQIEDAFTRQTLANEAAGNDLYSPEILYGHQDFRVLLALRYVKRLAEQYGVRTELAMVLSLPLGASEITTEEAARLYEGITSGQTWTFEGETATGQAEPLDATTLLIAEIRDLHGKVIYKAKPVPSRVANAAVGQMTADILRNVIRHGTGQSAKTALSADGATVPLGGKTGTTNDFKNAAFHGVLPGATPAGYAASEGLAVAVYAGYDDNRPMKRERISVAGSVGALPAWILTVQGVQAVRGSGPKVASAAVDGVWPMARVDSLVVRPVRTFDGTVVPTPDGSGATVLTRSKREFGEGPGPGPTERQDRKKGWWRKLF